MALHYGLRIVQLGGRDIGLPERWDMSIRTDPEGQNVYGPSLATVENVVVEPCGSGGQCTKHVTTLGLSKATHEFLTLHYFALDSADWWEHILGELLPDARLPDAVVRIGPLLRKSLLRFILPRRTGGILIPCGSTLSVSLLISSLGVEWAAIWVQCKDLPFRKKWR